MSNSTDSQSDWQQGDSRLREFLRRASPILAAERGWNERSQAKIKSLAEDLQLPDDLYDAGVQRLKKGDLQFEDQFTAYEQQFIKYLHRQFTKSQNNVLTAAHETTAIRVARREYEIGQVRARQLVRQVAEQLGISRVSKLDAVEYVASLIDETIVGPSAVTDRVRGRIFEAGKKWGVESGQVEILIRNRVEANRQTLTATRPWHLRIVAAVLSTAGVILIAWLTWSFVVKTLEKNNSGDIYTDKTGDAAEKVSGEDDNPEHAAAGRPPAWWSADTVLEFQEFTTNRLAARFPHDILKSANADERITGYRKIITLVKDGSGELREAACQLFARFYRDETNDVSHAMDSMIQELGKLPPDRLPANTRVYTNAWRANDFLTACSRTTIPFERLTGMDDVAIEITGVSLRQEDFAMASRQGLATRQWQHLQLRSYAQPELAARLIDSLGDVTRRELGETVNDEYSTVVTLLTIRPGVWTHMRRALERIVTDADNDQLRELFARKTVPELPELQSWLGLRIAKRLEIDTKRLTASRIDLAIEKRLSLESIANRAIKTRWKQLRESHSFPDLSPEKKVANPQTIANAAHLATIAVLLHQAGRSGDPATLAKADELFAESPNNLAVRTTVDPEIATLPIYRRTRRRALPSDIQSMKKGFEVIKTPASSTSAVRTLAFERIAKAAPRIREVSNEQAVQLAKYMLSATGIPELVAIEKHCSLLRHWPNLALALADEILTTDGTLDQAITCAGLLTGIQPEFNNQNWRNELHRLMLERIAMGLKYTAEVDGDDTRYQWNELRRTLMKLYRIRCQATGVPAVQVNVASTPGELCELFAAHFHAGTTSRSWTAGSLEPVFQANRYLASNEIQLLVLHGRSLIELQRPAAATGTSAIAKAGVEQLLLQNELDLLQILLGTVE